METHEKGVGKLGTWGGEGLEPDGNNNRSALLRLPPVKRFTLQSGAPGVAKGLEIARGAAVSKGSGVGEGVRGVCLTATQCSQNLGGLWVAERSTWWEPASPFSPPPSPSEGTQSRHCVGNDCALKMEPRRSKRQTCVPLAPRRRQLSSLLGVIAANPSVFILFAAKSHQILFLG